jgi:hypothetical protein
MGDAPRPGRRVGEVLGFAVRDQVRHRFEIGLRADHQHVLDVGDLRDRRELLQVVGQIGEQGRVDGGITDRHQRDRVTVGRRLGDRRHGDIAVGAGAVLDDHALAPALRHAVGDDARERVRRAAGGEADDDAHRPRWIVVG